MNSFIAFYQEAEKSLDEKNLDGIFRGIRLKDDEVVFVHESDTEKETVWPEARAVWVEIFSK